eukprot:TRINITY_DN15378_c0_g1_i1.p1 TRINITY_DN15378_c0_g1~~TRINITY_DN15378_c0_g1_i1.p1  ORF type:complete len:226 (+),score=62.62 TRINITY_DN15378_c0_g1_i1:38-715(+)
MKLYFFLFVIINICFCYEQKYPTPEPCTFVDSNFNIYDLSPLYANYESEELTITDNYGMTYNINICGNSNNNNCSPENGVCQGGDYNSYYGCGNADDQEFQSSISNGEGVQLIYPNGQFCYGIQHGRVSTLNLICDETVEGAVIDSVLENPICNYNFNIRSSSACSVGSEQPPVDGNNNCCAYEVNSTGDYKTACTSASSCPQLNGLTNIGDFPVNDCSDCKIRL